MIALYIIGGVIGYAITGLLVTLFFPVYTNLFEIATFQFEKFNYDWDYVTDFFNATDDDEILFVILYMIFWPIVVAGALVILPFIFFFNLIKFLIYLPTNLAEKAAQKVQDEENYKNHVEYQYKKIMEEEHKNDNKN